MTCLLSDHRTSGEIADAMAAEGLAKLRRRQLLEKVFSGISKGTGMMMDVQTYDNAIKAFHEQYVKSPEIKG